MNYLQEHWKESAAIIVGILIVIGLLIIGDRGREIREDDVHQGGMGVPGSYHLETP